MGAGVALDVEELDIQQFITTGGFHVVELSSTALGVIQAQIDFTGLFQSL